MLAMSTLMMPAPTMACAPPIAVGPHKPPEAKLLAIHPTHAQTTPQHQIHAQQQQPQQCQQQQLSSSNKPEHYHIFVGDLSPEIETQQLKDAFAPFGDISREKNTLADPLNIKAKRMREACRTDRLIAYCTLSMHTNACARANQLFSKSSNIEKE